MDLKHLTDHALLIDTKRLASHERRISTEILHHLKEIDLRKLYSDLKYSSLFDYCLYELGYSESAAHRRIVAARMINDIPELESKLNNGSLNLTNIAQAGQFFKQHEIDSMDVKKDILLQVEKLSTRECEKKLLEISGEEKNVREIDKRISKNKIHLSFVLSDETGSLFKKAKTLIGKSSSEETILFMAQAAIEKIEKSKYKLSSKKLLPAPKVTRVISAGLRKEVYSRDKKCIKCGSLFHLNFDHKKPYALGGMTSKENMQLLCFNCNQRKRIKEKL